MHQGILEIERWGNQSCIWNVVKKTKKINQKLEEIGQIISQTFVHGPKDDRI
jgi:hypothetical protein